MDSVLLQETIECLAQHGIDVDAEKLKLADPNEFLRRLIEACRKAAAEEEEYEEARGIPDPNGPVQMSLGFAPDETGREVERVRNMTTAEAVREFESMLPRSKSQITGVRLPF